MKTYKPKSIKNAIDFFQDFLECDLYTKFRPEMKVKKEVYKRTDYFKNEKEFIEYLRFHFDILRKQIRGLKFIICKTAYLLIV
jgi:hypothetical protein